MRRQISPVGAHMHTDRLKLVRSEGGVDYYMDTLDPYKQEFGIPRSAIRNAPHMLSETDKQMSQVQEYVGEHEGKPVRITICPSPKPNVRSKVRIPVKIESRDGCYRIGGMGVGGGS